MNFDGMLHPHSFYRDDGYPQVSEAKVQKNRIEINSWVYGLMVFKSTGSQFHGSQLFLRYGIEHYPDLNCKLTKKPRETMTFVREAAPRFDEAWLDPFSSKYHIIRSDHILQTNTSNQVVKYKLPNKHYNKSEIYLPQTDPNRYMELKVALSQDSSEPWLLKKGH
ncbi:Uricase [Golovinomyces cichoracearum]|uniref:Uricase n=1 Tax=Golovinomyces cichoracearum TaxID=62708 RepID=A0A420INL5_9PEZI|nr:Uricase [Golovinomyces cichoracearum]